MCTGSHHSMSKLLESVTSVDEHLKTLLALVESELSFCFVHIPHESTESIVNMIQHDI